MNFIFDMDGVLVNSNEAHLASWKKIASEDNVVFSDETFWKTFGMTSEYIVETYWPKANLSQSEIAQIVERKETAFRESIPEFVNPIEGAVEFVHYLAQRGCKLAVGSSAPRINVETVLETFNLKPFFEDRVVAGDEVRNGKPAPDIFLLAAKKLCEAPENCVVIDDSRSGVTAGKRSGAVTIGFFSSGHTIDEYENADFIVQDFNGVKKVLNLVD